MGISVSSESSSSSSRQSAGSAAAKVEPKFFLLVERGSGKAGQNRIPLVHREREWPPDGKKGDDDDDNDVVSAAEEKEVEAKKEKVSATRDRMDKAKAVRSKSAKTSPKGEDKFNEYAQSCFWQAVQSDDDELAAALVDQGVVDLDFRAMTLDTWLHLAVMNNSTKVGKLLMKLGADIGAENDEKAKPLHMAAMGGHTDFVKLLVEFAGEAGSKDSVGLNSLDAVGCTPLTFALIDRDYELAKVLVEAGADPKEIQVSAGTSLIHTLFDPHEEEEDEVKTKASREFARWLLKDEHWPHDHVSADMTALVNVVVESGDVDAAEILFDGNGPNFDDLAKYHGADMYPLLLAVAAGHKDMAGYLISRGATVKKADELGATGKLMRARGGLVSLAVVNGKADLVEMMFNAEADTHKTGPNVWPALHMAAQIADTDKAKEIITLLLNDVGAECVDKTYDVGNTMLSIALSQGHTELAKWLVDEKGASVHGGRGRKTPLVEASQYGNVEAMEFLIDRGAEVNALDSFTFPSYFMSSPPRYAPIHKATLTDNLECIKLLAKRGADVNARAMGTGDTAMTMAVMNWGVSGNSKAEMIQLLSELGADANAKRKDGNTALHLLRDAEVAVALLELDVDPNIKNDLGKTPLEDAITKLDQIADAELVRAMIKHGAKTDIGFPLHTAVQINRYEKAKVLLEEGGADPGAKRDEDGATPLLLAASMSGYFGASDKNILDLLLEHAGKKSVDVRAGKDGKTPLVAAVEAGIVSSVTSLLRKGADPNVARKSDGVTALHLVCQKPYSQLPSWAATNDDEEGDGEKAKKEPPPKEEYAEEKDPTMRMAKMLLFGGADANAEDKEGRTPLHYAAAQDNVELMKLLVEKHRAEVIKDDSGRSPMALAAEAGAFEAGKYLLDKCRVNPDSRIPLKKPKSDRSSSNRRDSNSGVGPYETPLLIAARGGFKRLVDALVAAGANDLGRDADGKTAADFAGKMGFEIKTSGGKDRRK